MKRMSEKTENIIALKQIGNALYVKKEGSLYWQRICAIEDPLWETKICRSIEKVVIAPEFKPFKPFKLF